MGNGTGVAATFGGQDAQLGNFNLSGIKTLDYNSVISNGTMASGATIAWASGGVQIVGMTGASPRITMVAPIGVAKLTLFLTQGVSAASSPTFAPAPKWTGAAPPSFSSGGNKIDIVTFIWDGTNYYGVLSPNFA